MPDTDYPRGDYRGGLTMRLTLTDDHGDAVCAIDVAPHDLDRARMSRFDSAMLIDRLLDARPEYRCAPGERTDPTVRCTWHSTHHHCQTCQGWYGVPHDSLHVDTGVNAPHPFGSRSRDRCACRPCLVETIRSAFRTGRMSQKNAIDALRAGGHVHSYDEADRLLHTPWSTAERYG